MSYLINKFNGDSLVVLEDGTLDISTSLGLVGRNYSGYGETFNENFVFLLENFANEEPPSRPLEGQLWFDTSNEILKIYNGTDWGVVGAAELSDTPPQDKRPGSLWLDTSSNSLNIWSGTTWLFIGPESAQGFGITRARSTVLTDDNNNLQPVILLTINDTVIGLIANNTFRLSLNDSISGFLDIKPGINLSSSVSFNGSLSGVSSSATILESTRTINGIGFNGSQDITITANTTNTLVAGSYIDGSNFNGAQTVVWDIDATSSNQSGRIVARDANGNFSAGTISANIVGDLTGDVISTNTSRFNIVIADEIRGAVLSGNAFTASKLRNPVEINGVDFDGSQNITIPIAGTEVSGDTLASNIKFSGLESVGILQSLRVNDLGITVGSGNELQLSVPGSSPRINSGQGTLEITSNNAGVNLYHSTRSPSGRTTLSPTSSQIDIGSSSQQFSRIYAETIFGQLNGNASTATLAERSSNLQGGGLGAIPYQTSSGTTSFVPPVANKILKSNASGIPSWGDPVFPNLIPGEYIDGESYAGSTEQTWNIEATVTNTPSKLVARDANGNFSAGTITASLNGNSSTATTLQTARTINGVAFNGTANITIVDSTKAPIDSPTLTGTPKSVTPPSTDNSTRIATTEYVKTVFGTRPFWAGDTNLSNVISTYSGFPAGTRVSFWEERSYTRSANSNGGRISIVDRYRRTVEKAQNGTWFDIG